MSHIFKRAFRELRPYRTRMAITVASVVMRGALLMLPPLLTRQILDVAVDRGDLHALWRYTAASLGATVLAVLLILADVWAASYVQDVAAGLRTRLYRSLLERPLAFFQQTKTGDLLARLLQDSQSFSDMFFDMYGGGIISTASFAVVTASVGLAAMLWMDVPLALACVAVYLLQVVAMYLFAPLMRSAATQLVAARAHLTETVRETVTGAAYVKTAGLGSNVTERFEARLATLERSQLRQLWVDRWNSLALILPEMLGVGTVYLYGGYRVLTGHLTVGGLMAFAVYAWWLQNPVEILTQSVGKRLRRWLPGVERTFAFLDDEGAGAGQSGAGAGQSGAGAGGLRPEVCQGALSLEGVTFGYDPGRPILQGLSLTVAPGEMVAVVGPSGVGKSTLGDLLLGLQQPQSGRICLDGHDLRTLDPTWLRRQVCAIAQDVTVLNETVAANVAYGRPDAATAEVAAACDSAAVTEFAAGLPHGLETPVGERGLQLSGGQRQRLSIARALLYGPQVLVLDEATSALDMATEARVMGEIRRQLAGRTLVVIAHRLSTVVDADRILVLDGGRVAEEGSHADLMARGGLYRQLYAREATRSDEEAACQ